MYSDLFLLKNMEILVKEMNSSKEVNLSIFEFLDLRKNHGKEENRARDLFFSLWVLDLFMKRV